MAEGIDRPPGCVYRLDGTHVTDEAAFYLAMGEGIVFHEWYSAG